MNTPQVPAAHLHVSNGNNKQHASQSFINITMSATQHLASLKGRATELRINSIKNIQEAATTAHGGFAHMLYGLKTGPLSGGSVVVIPDEHGQCKCQPGGRAGACAVVTNCHRLSALVCNYHQLSPTVRNCHQLSLPFSFVLLQPSWWWQASMTSFPSS
jgi:hypothetical protein